MTPHGCGLCYDSGDDEYKVILIYKSFYAVYCAKRDYWMKKTSSKLQKLDARSRECNKGINVDGHVFWSLGQHEIRHVCGYCSIIHFDMKSDELKEFPQPDFMGGYDHLFRLTSFKGCVGLYGGNYHQRDECDVWIMEQGGWTMLTKITCHLSDFRLRFDVENIVFLGCTRNGKVLFQVGWGLERLVMYDPKRHKFTKPFRISKDSKHDIIPICWESFYFPKHNIG